MECGVGGIQGLSLRCPKLWPRVAMRIKLHIYADDVTRLACLADFQAVQCLVTIVLILSRNFAILATRIPYDSKNVVCLERFSRASFLLNLDCVG